VAIKSSHGYCALTLHSFWSLLTLVVVKGTCHCWPDGDDTSSMVALADLDCVFAVSIGMPSTIFFSCRNNTASYANLIS
jgi:hypothetical protein